MAHNKVLNGNWPGTQMTETRITSDGTVWWTQRFDVDYETINIIFNAGNSQHQTQNIEGLAPGNHYFIYDGNKTYQDVTDQCYVMLWFISVEIMGIDNP